VPKRGAFTRFAEILNQPGEIRACRATRLRAINHFSSLAPRKLALSFLIVNIRHLAASMSAAESTRWIKRSTAASVPLMLDIAGFLLGTFIGRALGFYQLGQAAGWLEALCESS
jgi:hypothetical protein